MRISAAQVLYYVVLSDLIKASLSGGLKWVRVNVPQYRSPGEMAQLQCDYDLGNDTLYAVKWYKEHEEFYRFVPKARPQTTSYKLEGVHVDMHLSDNRKVVLKGVNLKTSGLYKCEVSAEAPNFSSAQSEARMEVVYLPKENPVITGVEKQYAIGDVININCTSDKSHPAPTIHWYINQQQVTSQDALIQYQPMHHRHGLVSVTLGLQFKLGNRHFLGGSMRVKCLAFVSPVLWTGDRESVVQSLPIKDMSREALLLGEWILPARHVKSSGYTPTTLSAAIIALCLALAALN